MAKQISEQDRWADLDKKPKNIGKLFKTFVLAGGIAVLAGGSYQGIKLVQENSEKEKSAKMEQKWRDINSGADSLSVDMENKTFYAMKKVDEKKVAELKAKKAEFEQQKQEIIQKANKAFTKALQSRNVDAMKAAVEMGADNINKPNAKGQTPLVQMIKEAEAVKAFQAARYLISINVDVNVKDKDGATAMDYAATMNSLKGQTLQREIAEKKDAEVNKGGNSKELRELNDILAKADARIAEEINMGYTAKVDKGHVAYSSEGYDESFGYFSDGSPAGGGALRLRDETVIDRAQMIKLLRFHDEHLK